jgi:CRISPR system Cascade subunit CasD
VTPRLVGVGLRLEGPMQSWGASVAGDDRPSLDVPTKSGVVGIIGAALGIEREDVGPLQTLHAALALVVRVDRAGVPGVDYHTTLEVPTAEGKIREAAVLSRRGYLYDASFAVVVVLVADNGPELAGRIVAALGAPRFPLYLGRRACPPSVPVLASPRVLEGARWEDLLAQLPDAIPFPGSKPIGRNAERDRQVHVEASLGGGAHRPRVIRDQLVGPLARMFGERRVHPMRLEPAQHLPQDNTVDPWFPSTST